MSNLNKYLMLLLVVISKGAVAYPLVVTNYSKLTMQVFPAHKPCTIVSPEGLSYLIPNQSMTFDVTLSNAIECKQYPLPYFNLTIGINGDNGFAFEGSFPFSKTNSYCIKNQISGSERYYCYQSITVPNPNYYVAISNNGLEFNIYNQPH